jgi:hypothetical protein
MSFFYFRFAGHYNGNRAPFLMIVDPSWASNQDKRDGTAEFLQYIRSAFTVYHRMQFELNAKLILKN